MKPKPLSDLLGELQKAGVISPIEMAKVLDVDAVGIEKVLETMSSKKLLALELYVILGWGAALGYFYALKREIPQ